MNLYCISGLGADESVFRFIQFPTEWNIIHIKWKPIRGVKSLREYAMLMGEEIDQSQPFCLCGISFGGMLCSELCNVMKPEKVILISSAATSGELPWIYRMLGSCHLERLLPLGLFHHYSNALAWIFGPANIPTKKMLKKIVEGGDPAFIRKALGLICRWTNTRTPQHLIQIHADGDRVLWPGRSHANYKVHNGGHLFMLTHPTDLNAILDMALKSPADQ